MNMTNAEDLYAKLLKNLRDRKDTFELAGLAMGGAWIAERLARDLSLPHYGVINVAFHRDDYAEKGMTALRTASTMPTNLPFEVAGANIVLLDDVLLTGRTVRAALNELFDFGRPASVELMVLADRGKHELPVMADFVGEEVSIPDHQILVLDKNTSGQFSFQIEERAS
ncbi:bifunctional pyr operon transcriptional regulator/uracil phosphoribosyltransferase PyrR [Polynucleobacter paneuropaeus]|uniref:Bifunctional pyr operon transcriptional regulator/uracil phosphoribosyltransferase PyrR n=1 Tax=Polynucleobacter paneuropaeus TaxID=2527775 RepID=A0A2Z4JKV5_9BURK|nr:bifunctional pyr operon transcriptional regulator/uracil phosphoribosyltransferase PyrR [Polynucleobacter paneuropaeus]AWW45575.1 bifunctional pyr operon transcriptional regulator/uracil phosphoribosyltransferase PyrR [Polynucleobacter paneuropaeus]AWW49128.1 bifunctional pyr operon transcriptional regulator/uracil phosphoribosyltransferase PyrR [Polynucleobacter paneuropaeus]MBT8518953.1 bifunctional pyr operon transcriptional regulator/uracil phosphoribosyltransferase PyrR [Polynucleobacter